MNWHVIEHTAMIGLLVSAMFALKYTVLSKWTMHMECTQFLQVESDVWLFSKLAFIVCTYYNTQPVFSTYFMIFRNTSSQEMLSATPLTLVKKSFGWAMIAHIIDFETYFWARKVKETIWIKKILSLLWIGIPDIHCRHQLYAPVIDQDTVLSQQRMQTTALGLRKSTGVDES